MDGIKRPVASILELLTIDFVELLGEIYASDEEFMDDAQLRGALRMYLCEGDLTEHGQVEVFVGPTRGETHHSPVYAREINLDDALGEVQGMVTSGNYPGMLSVSKAVVP